MDSIELVLVAGFCVIAVIQFGRDGYLIIENFLTQDEISMLKKSCHRIVEEMSPAEHAKVVFKTNQEQEQSRTNYFIESGDKIRFFFGEKALNEKGEILVDKHNSLIKIGHALHWLVPEFKQVTFSKKVQNAARSLGYVDPRIVQSMYIFKPPNIGGEVGAHQDATFVCNIPLKLFGIWIPLDNCTKENGCLQFVPGSHKTNPCDIWMRGKEDGAPGTYFTSTFNYPHIRDDQYVPEETKAGSLVLIDGQVIHRSSPNLSEKLRHAYTFHVYDGHQSEWDSRCWVQPTQALPFPSLYQEP